MIRSCSAVKSGRFLGSSFCCILFNPILLREHYVMYSGILSARMPSMSTHDTNVE